MNYKKLTSLVILFCLLLVNTTPIFAITDKTKKSFFKKNKQQEESILDYINLSWWQDYKDEYLEEYILRAIDNNKDLKLANLKVEAARYRVNMQFSQELPTIGIGASPALVKMPGVTNTESMFGVPMIASYELDIFLKNHDKTKSVKKVYEASKLSERATYIAVISAVGATYYNIVKADELISLQEQIVKDRKTIFELMKARNLEGITSTSDLVKSEKAYIAADSTLTELKKARYNLLTALAVLIGDSAENISEYKRISYNDIKSRKEIPNELMSDVITKRPDYLIAEKMIEKAGIDVRVAKKEFLPVFNISGLIALMTSSSGGSMSWQNAISGLGGMIFWPILTGGSRITNLKLNKNQYEQAIQEYQKTNLTALKEVNDSLNNLKYSDEKYNKNANVYKIEQKDYKFAEDRYREGIISYLDLIQQKETLLSTRKLLVSSDIDIFIDQISLYKAVGATRL